MREALRQREFRLLWAGQAANVLGDRLIIVALAIYVTDLAGPTALGIVMAAQFVPFVALLVFGGVWADRLPRQLVMVATDIGRLGLHGLLAVLIFADAVEVWHIVVIEFLYGGLMAFFRPAYSGLLPQTVPEELIQQAQAVTSVTSTVASFLGPALGTALVLGLGPGWAFAFDAATYALSAAFLVRMRPRERGERSARASTWRELRDGWGAFVANTWVWAIVLCAATAMLLIIAPFQTLGPQIGEDEYGSAGYYGVIVTMFGLGTAGGSLLAGLLRPRYKLRISHLLLMPHGAVVAAYAAGAPFELMLVLFGFSGIAIGLFAVWWETAIAEAIPPHLLSRVSSYDWMGSMAFVPIGYALAGPMAALVGTTTLLVTGAIILLIVDLAALPSVWRR